MYGIFVSHDQVFRLLRKIAKKDYWQVIYGQAKELSGLSIFKNRNNYTYFQVYFLNQLTFYSSIYMDISMGEVSELVMDNEIYEDAYTYYRQHKDNPKNKLNTQKTSGSHSMKLEQVVNKNEFVFTRVKGSQT